MSEILSTDKTLYLFVTDKIHDNIIRIFNCNLIITPCRIMISLSILLFNYKTFGNNKL